MGKLLLHSLLLLGCTACTDQLYQSSIPPNDRRTVVAGDTIHSFTVATQDFSGKVRPDVYYTWYLRNSFTSTQGGYEGTLLHGSYTKILRDNTLLEKGQFREGLKDGEWITWHNQGATEGISRWDRGKPTGRTAQFLMGKVSYSEKLQSVAQPDGQLLLEPVSKSWYSYDERGRVVWMVQEIAGLGVKSVDYAYNGQGNVRVMANQKGLANLVFYCNLVCCLLSLG